MELTDIAAKTTKHCDPVLASVLNSGYVFSVAKCMLVFANPLTKSQRLPDAPLNSSSILSSNGTHKQEDKSSNRVT